MPNRILRADILTSERLNKLSIEAECFFRRLMSIVDDYGRFDGNLTLLRSSCFPLRIDAVKDKDIAKWIKECQKVNVLLLYSVNGKNYLEIDNFGQQRRSKSKFPEPEHGDVSDIICSQVISDDDICSLSRSRSRSRSREADESKKQKSKRVTDMDDEEYLEDLKARPEFAGLDIKREVILCQQWCEKNNQVFGRNRLVNWLKRADRPMAVKSKPIGPPMEVVR